MAAVTLIEEPASPELRQYYELVAKASGGLGVLNIFKAMAHSPELMQAWGRMMAVLLNQLTLDPRLRELAILRLFQLKPSAYGFAHHVRIGKQAGVTDDEIAALDGYAKSDLFSELDRLVLEYTDAITSYDERAPKLAAALRSHLSERELVELTFCIANWNLMAHLLLPLEIALEEPVRQYLPPDW